jgi:pimeloyl-ACP methyl ester carboxylesterase
MNRLRRPLALLLGVMALLAIASTEPVARRLRATRLLVALGAASSAPGAKSDTGARLVESELTLNTTSGPIRARLYRTAGPPGPGLVIAHGVHYRSIDEARLVPFARELARAGRVVLTPELRDLADYRITAHGIDVISESARWLSEQRTLVRNRKVGLLGFSFAGGLALVAAQRPELRERVEFVSSVGGHHDLSRVLMFLVDQRIETPEGLQRANAHEYGLVVLVYQHLEQFVDEADRTVVGDSLRFWLREDRVSAWARASQRSTESGERLFQLLALGKLRQLAPRLSELIAQQTTTLRSLSPRGHLRDLRVPVYLLHGSADSVIPPSETDWAARELRGSWHRALVSPLLDHVEIRRTARLQDELALIDFMSELL